MDDEILIICAAAIVCLGAVYFKNTRRKTRRIWVNPYLQGRVSKGRFRSDVRQSRWTIELKYNCVECVFLV